MFGEISRAWWAPDSHPLSARDRTDCAHKRCVSLSVQETETHSKSPPDKITIDVSQKTSKIPMMERHAISA